jgi:glycine/D-amino acid oxidase-like deaminating enzyme
VVGGGAFGASAALALAQRGHAVLLVDPGPLPHPDAASTDISKVVRLDYGTDAFYTELGERALARWRTLGTPFFHETGFVVLTSEAMAPGSFEQESFALLGARGHALDRLDAAAITHRFAAWRAGRHRDGYYNPEGGWAASGRVVAELLGRARAAGVVVREGARFAGFEEAGDRVAGVRVVAGTGEERLAADVVVVAAGAWTPALLPELAGALRVVGQPVLHFRPDDAAPFRPPAFPCWAADIARTGWYGFPANDDGIVKIANHGPGVAVDPRGPRVVPEDAEPRFRAFVRDALPALARAPVVFRRLCLYCDSFDGDFWIDHHPDRAGLVVAAGDSGHAFKFTPVLGDVIADVVERRPNRFAGRFGWRVPDGTRREQARAPGPEES